MKKTLAMVKHAFTEQSISSTRVFEWESLNSLSMKMARQLNRKAKSMLIVFWHQGNCSQIIHPGRPNSQFSNVLWYFTDTARKYAKISPRNLATNVVAVASRERTSQIPCSLGNFWSKITRMSCLANPTRPTCLLRLFLFLRLKIVLFWHDWGDWCRISRWTSSQNTTPMKHLKMTEALGEVRTHGRGYF
jgi:hypothetical protein